MLGSHQVKRSRIEFAMPEFTLDLIVLGKR